MLNVEGSNKYKIGIDIGGSHIGVGIVNRSGDILEECETEILLNNRENIERFIIKTIVESIQKILNTPNLNIDQIDYIGVGSPGTINNNIIVHSGKLNVKNFNIALEIKKQINIPINVLNDAKCAGIAEKLYGSIKEYSDAVLLTLGTGIGAAVFSDNKLLIGKKYIGYEIGHMVICAGGEESTCGRRGCFEQYAAMGVFKDKIKKRLKINDELDGKEILQLVNQQYNKVQDIINEYIYYLSIGIGNLINIFEPEVVTIRRKLCLL